MKKLLQIPKPEWYAKLESGDVLPPPPDGGWGRWWNEYDGVVWLLLVAGAIGLVFRLLEAAGERVIKS